jgi:hypothetical protein
MSYTHRHCKFSGYSADVVAQAPSTNNERRTALLRVSFAPSFAQGRTTRDSQSGNPAEPSSDPAEPSSEPAGACAGGVDERGGNQPETTRNGAGPTFDSQSGNPADPSGAEPAVTNAGGLPSDKENNPSYDHYDDSGDDMNNEFEAGPPQKRTRPNGSSPWKVSAKRAPMVQQHPLAQQPQQQQARVEEHQPPPVEEHQQQTRIEREQQARIEQEQQARIVQEQQPRIEQPQKQGLSRRARARARRGDVETIERRRNLESAERRRNLESGARLVNRKDGGAAGVTIPVSRNDTCVADAIAHIISSILSEENCKGLPLPNGTFLESHDMEKHLRDSLSPNGERVKMGIVESFLPSIGFQATIMMNELIRSKVAVLTRKQGCFLVVCELKKDGEEANHAVAYLANKRWLVDNSPYQKVMQLEDTDIEYLECECFDKEWSEKQNRRARKQKANEIFKQRFDGAANVILIWYEISRKNDGRLA